MRDKTFFISTKGQQPISNYSSLSATIFVCREAIHQKTRVAVENLMISTKTSKIPLAQPLRNLRGCMHRIEGIHWSHAQGGQAHHGDAVSGILCWFISTKEICGVGVFDSCPLAQMIAASFQAYTSCWIFDIKFLCVSIQTQIEDSVLAEIIFVPNGILFFEVCITQNNIKTNIILNKTFYFIFKCF